MSEEEPGPKMSFTEHLDELLSRLKVALYAVIVSALTISFLPADFDFHKLLKGVYKPMIAEITGNIQRDLLPEGMKLIAQGVSSIIQVYLIVGLLIGVIFASPVIAYEFIKFVNPALYPHERKGFYISLIAFVGLFILGVIFSYKLIIPITMRILAFLITSAEALPLLGIENFFSFVVFTTLLIGFGFTFPILIVYLIKADIIAPEDIETKRKWIYAGMLVAIAFLTPDPTIITDLLLLVPLIVLLEAAIWIGKREKRKELEKRKASHQSSR
ncbi:MAG: hypothetical protein DRJ31_01485 [Candidatus Methanomethylicota archaeon]|uniref:Sec-independent protein translocase protein TatC n=1 Tax=Thermoproteota archaeon TaxID=2056631 RepID=A0A497ESV0_9CREN|nr:MAG: hypothetical protein DRJ31_01485 [Candidatus Verstraetearchaeota archaeon]RLE52187.1 MAG: hypothetical protein DRJ33_04335 [Candidatus Verstraetearchaeota archaeon]